MTGWLVVYPISKFAFCFSDFSQVRKKKVSYTMPFFMIKDFFTLLPILLYKESCWLPKSAWRLFIDLASAFPIFLSCTSRKIKCYTHQNLISERKWTWWTWVQINVQDIMGTRSFLPSWYVTLRQWLWKLTNTMDVGTRDMALLLKTSTSRSNYVSSWQKLAQNTWYIVEFSHL